MRVYLDTETCGFYGLPVLIQYAIEDGEIILHEIWNRPIRETLELIEWLCQQEIIGFNLTFDWFQLCKIYTTLSMYPDWSAYPEDHIEELAILEEQARFQDICLKPKAACDLMLLARKGPYQSLMARDPVRIRRVPTALAFELAKELNKRVTFDDIYFAKSKDKSARWKVFDIVDKRTNTVRSDFKDVVLRFRASGSLKALYMHAFGEKDVITFDKIELDSRYRPNEVGYAPYALALGTPTDWKWTWPEVIREHILHWNYHTAARKYAQDDIVMTRRLYKELFHEPKPGDVDSDLACMVAACRWRGYSVDLDKIKVLRDIAVQKIKDIPTAAAPARRWLFAAMNDIEKLGVASTQKVILEDIAATWRNDDGTKHVAAERAGLILEARKAQKEIELYDKLLHARRFHASFVIIGTLSSRMSGADSLNAQGIKHTKNVREAFTLNDSVLRVLCGGDFKSFEVALAVKVFDSKTLEEAILSGKKIHALFGMELFPGHTYEEILASEGQDPDMYDSGKKGIFTIFYGGEEYTLTKRLGVAIETAQKAFQGLIKKHPAIGIFGKKVYDDFASLAQPNGLGTRIEYKVPKDHAESFLGFKRFFTLENRVVKALFDLATSPPESWKNLKTKVVRRERVQTTGGAVMSALFGAAFGIQSSIIRQAKNHYIQSPGAEITKATQHAIWNHQPVGIHPFHVQPMNIHDEIMCPTLKSIVNDVERSVKETVAKYKKLVPLLAIDWFVNIPDWSAKKGVPIVDAKDKEPAA